jgi:hypothetical protein
VTTLDLEGISAEFLTQCGSCDAGLPTSCTCPKRDFRPTMLELVREVERQRELIEVLRDTMVQFDTLNLWGELTSDRVTALLERMAERCEKLSAVSV